jgi:hypothetical protein
MAIDEVDLVVRTERDREFELGQRRLDRMVEWRGAKRLTDAEEDDFEWFRVREFQLLTGNSDSWVCTT